MAELQHTHPSINGCPHTVSGTAYKNLKSDRPRNDTAIGKKKDIVTVLNPERKSEAAIRTK
jgi:hypothetical protein